MLFFCPSPVPGGRAAEAPSREEGTRARSDPKSLRGEQQLHQERQGEARAKDGGQQGEQGGSPGRHAGEAAGEGTVRHVIFNPVKVKGKTALDSPDCVLGFLLTLTLLCPCVRRAGQTRRRSEEEQGAEGGSLSVDERNAQTVGANQSRTGSFLS